MSTDVMVNQATKNQAVLKWVDDCARLLRPDRIQWCDGSEAERDLSLIHI